MNRNKVKIVSAFLFVLAFCKLNAQPVPFVKVFGDSTLSEKALGVQQLSDGSIYVAGYQVNTSFGSNVTLFKLDEKGNEQWRKVLTSGNGTNSPNALLVSEDESQLLLVYETHDALSADVNSTLLYLDTSGMEMYKAEFGSDSLSEIFSHITPMDGEDAYLVSGFITGVTGFGNDFLLVKYDGQGNVLFRNSQGTAVNDVASSSVSVRGDFIFVSGDTQVDSGRYNTYYMAFNAKGDFLWDTVPGWPYNSGCKKSCMSVTGDMYVIGESSTATSNAFDVYLSKFDGQGQLLWQKLIPSTDKGDAGLDIIEIQPTNLLITGYGYNDSLQNTDIIALLVDSAGNEIRKRYYDAGGWVDLGLNVTSSVYGGYLIAGTGNPGTDNQYVLIYDQMPELYNGVAREVSKNMQWNLYPNPSNGILHINLDQPASKVVILTSEGRKVFESNTRDYQFSVAGLGRGMYLVQVFFDQYMDARHVVVRE